MSRTKTFYEIWDEFGDFVNIFAKIREAKRELKLLERMNPNCRFEIIASNPVRNRQPANKIIKALRLWGEGNDK